MKELSDLLMIFLFPSYKKVKTKDRPTLKVDTSALCNLSYFEIVGSVHDNTSPVIVNSVKVTKRK